MLAILNLLLIGFFFVPLHFHNNPKMGNINIPNIQFIKLRLSVFILLTKIYLTEPSKDFNFIIYCQAPRIVNIVYVGTQ